MFSCQQIKPPSFMMGNNTLRSDLSLFLPPFLLKSAVLFFVFLILSVFLPLFPFSQFLSPARWRESVLPLRLRGRNRKLWPGDGCGCRTHRNRRGTQRREFFLCCCCCCWNVYEGQVFMHVFAGACKTLTEISMHISYRKWLCLGVKKNKKQNSFRWLALFHL